MTFRTYRKRPVHVEAVRWWGPFVGDGKQGPTWRDLREFGCDAEPTSYWGLDCGEPGGKLNADIELPTLEGRMLCHPGDWIIRGVAGEFYPCKNEIFEETYETADGMPEDVGTARCCDV